MALKDIKSSKLQVEILGCGATFGVPIVGGVWGLCDPNNPKNMRTRPSIVVRKNDEDLFIIDAGPDFRLQTAAANVKPDTLLITHGHWDHIAGIGELPYYLEEVLKKDMHIYTDELGMEYTRGMFGYLFDDDDIEDGNLLTFAGENDEYRIIWHVIEPYKPLVIKDMEIVPFVQHHGYMDTLGFRIENFAYSPDVKSFPDASHSFLEGLHTWILDCDYWEPSDSHGDPEGVVELVNKFKPQHVYLTHMDEKMDYQRVSDWFKDRNYNNIIPGHDGLKIDIINQNASD
jgi:phosphoribosyl 1,2-cyclic phosphate phosphodiesterase